MAEGEPALGVRWRDVPVEMPEEGRTVAFEIDGRALLLCNAEGRPYVLHDECPHVRTSMAGAQIRGTLLECPMHGGLIDVRDGSPAGMPIRRAGICYAVRTQDGILQVAMPG
jgi:nitrite reductase/ring-hydroxylating ferredoxin subunit